MDGLKYAAQVEKWDLFEIEIQGKAEGNPFTDYEIQGVFTGKNETVRLTVFMTVMAFIECGLCHLLKENIDLK